MLKQLLNGINGLLLILTLNNTDLSLTCHCWVFLWPWRGVIVIFFRSKNKVLNLTVKFRVHFWNSVKFINCKKFKIHKIRIQDLCLCLYMVILGVVVWARPTSMRVQAMFRYAQAVTSNSCGFNNDQWVSRKPHVCTNPTRDGPTNRTATSIYWLTIRYDTASKLV